MTDHDRPIEIAQIVRPHGIAGELRVRLFNSDSEVLFDLEQVRLRLPNGTEAAHVIEAIRPTTEGFVLLRLEGVEDRNAAEELRGATLIVARSALPPPEEGEFYVCDILGAGVFLTDGTELGTVAEYRSYPSTDVIVVHGKGKRWEVPLVDDFIASVDVPARRIELHSVEGLESD